MSSFDPLTSRAFGDEYKPKVSWHKFGFRVQHSGSVLHSRLKEQEIGCTMDNGTVDKLIMRLHCFLIESLNLLHFGGPTVVN